MDRHLLAAYWTVHLSHGYVVELLPSLAVACIGAFVGATGTFLFGQRMERRRQAHDERMLLRSERRAAVARLLSAVESYQHGANCSEIGGLVQSTAGLRDSPTRAGSSSWHIKRPR